MIKEAHLSTTNPSTTPEFDTEEDWLFEHYHRILLLAETEKNLSAQDAFARYFQEQPALARVRSKVYDLMFLQ